MSKFVFNNISNLLENSMLQPNIPYGHSYQTVRVGWTIRFCITTSVKDSSLKLVINLPSLENLAEDYAKEAFPYTFTIKSSVVKGHLHYYGVTSKNLQKHYGDYTRQRVEHDMLIYYVAHLNTHI
jgi:hypothetical protein